jgi:mannose-6-phosphate isomerase-like protein (cupin superfamily)
MIVQSYVKRGCLVPMHAHDSEQMVYVLQGALRFRVAGEEITVREGEVLHIPSGGAPGRSPRGHLRARFLQPRRREWLGGRDDDTAP